MPKSILYVPFLGGFLAYVLAKGIGITDGLAVFGIAIFGMLIAGIGGLVMSRRTRR